MVNIFAILQKLQKWFLMHQRFEISKIKNMEKNNELEITKNCLLNILLFSKMLWYDNDENDMIT